jgi:hypothetical protein
MKRVKLLAYRISIWKGSPTRIVIRGFGIGCGALVPSSALLLNVRENLHVGFRIGDQSNVGPGSHALWLLIVTLSPLQGC